MRIIPGLFIQHGKAVSLYKGTENAQKKVYSKAPYNYASFFQQQGAKTLLVVDLDGNQRARLPEIKQHFSGEIWWAGGVRDLATLKELFAAGAHRVVLGQSAEGIFVEALKLYGTERLIAGIQAFSNEEIPELCEKRVALGFRDIIVKDMNADGTLFHPNFDLMEKCVYFSKANIFASGGIGEENDLHLLNQTGVKGAIIARALYEQRLSLPPLLHHFEVAKH